ncbi:MAG: hypothetical protein AUK08_03405 [Candidatus Pacebacteria bacterium CG2_30_36_39]|nr:hypothetical protein [Candidatus Pacearchaeota archaeon]OIP73593.1 MAG: hypothetical protein AUK08_03405 [Candidatus Pacebacteria bacterium CG2_30_36_39]
MNAGEIVIKIVKAREPLAEVDIPNWLLSAAKEIDQVIQTPRHNGSLLPRIIKEIEANPHAQRNDFLNRMRIVGEDAELVARVSEETIGEEDGILVPERIFTQEEPRSCSVANATTFLGCLTDEVNISEHQLSSSLIHVGKTEKSKIAVGERDYDFINFLKLVNTSSFASQFPEIDFSSQEFMGCDFVDLVKMMQEVARETQDQFACFVVCFVESSLLKNTLHEIILTGVKDGIVTYDDPETSNHNGGMSKTMSVKDFLKRWAVGLFGGYMIKAKEKDIEEKTG